MDTIRGLRRELGEAREPQTATSEVLEVISSSPGELQRVFETMLTNATRLCEAKFGTLYLCEEDKVRFAAAYGVPPAFAEARAKEPFIPDPDTGLGKAFTTKQAVQVADLAATQSYAERKPIVVAAVELAGIRTGLGVPMLKDNELVGVLGIYRQEVRPFSDKQIELVKNFAAQAEIELTRIYLDRISSVISPVPILAQGRHLNRTIECPLSEVNRTSLLVRECPFLTQSGRRTRYFCKAAIVLRRSAAPGRATKRIA